MDKLPYCDCGSFWPLPERIIVEPRKLDGSLDVKRIGAEKLVNITGHICTSTQLCDVFFRYNPDAKNATGQDVMNWLCDNGLMARARTWN